MCLRGGDGLALVDEPGHERAQVGALADAAVREPRQRAERIRRRVEDHLAPLRAARVGDGVGRHPRARARVGETLDLVRRRGLRLERAERRVALHVPLDVTGREHAARRERGAADHALDVLRDRLLVADAVLHRSDAAAGEGVGRRFGSRRCVHRLRRDDAEVALAGARPASDVARTRPTTSPAPESLSPCALIASTCSRARS